MQTELRMEVRTLVERATRWLVNNRRRPIDIEAAVEQLADGVQVRPAGPARRLLIGREREAFDQRLQELPRGRRARRARPARSRCCRPRTPR